MIFIGCGGACYIGPGCGHVTKLSVYYGIAAQRCLVDGSTLSVGIVMALFANL